MRILMMLAAGAAGRPNRSLGLGQVVEPYYLLHDAGAEVVVASVLGGDPPMRGARKRMARPIPALQRFRDDRRARDVVSDTVQFGQIWLQDFDGGICIGALEEAAVSDADVARGLVSDLLAAGKPVAVVPSDARLSPLGPLEGLLIVGDKAWSPPLAAKALLAAINLGGR